MKHCILVKWNSSVEDKKKIIPDIKTLFDKLKKIDGINDVNVIPCCTDIENRYDLMIVIDMEKETLECYDSSDVHKNWKAVYTKYMQSKAIFDYE